MMSKSKALMVFSVGFALGIWAASIFGIANFFAFTVLAVVSALWGLTVFLQKQPGGEKSLSRKRQFVIAHYLFLCAAFFCLGILRLNASFQANQFADLFEQKVKIYGFVTEDPDVRENNQLLTVLPEGFSQKIMLTLPKQQDFFYGDKIYAEGKIRAVENFSEFDYVGYLQRFGVYARMQSPKVLILKSNQLNPIKYRLLRFKALLSETLSRRISKPESDLLLGILIGAKRGLPQEVQNNFSVAGISHIVAVSGYNVSVIILAFSLLAWVIGRKSQFWVGLVFLGAFTLIAGASASVVRAAVMGGILLLSFFSGRLYAIGPSLCLAAFVMLLVNPKILYWDIGFQLSFAATVGIVYGMRLFEKQTKAKEDVLGIKSIIFSSLCALAATLPLTLLNFGRLSPYALLANILVLPAVPWVMLFGSMALLPVIFPPFAFLSFVGLGYILKISAFVAGLPFAGVEITFTPVMAVGFYILLAWAYWRLSKKTALKE